MNWKAFIFATLVYLVIMGVVIVITFNPVVELVFEVLILSGFFISLWLLIYFLITDYLEER